MARAAGGGGKLAFMSRQQAVVFVVTWLSYVFVYVARKPVSIVKSSLTSELGLSASQLGNVDTAFLLTYTAGSFLGGRLGDLLGERTIIASSLAVNAAGCAAFAMAQDYASALITWGLCGLAQGCVYPCCLKALGTAFSPAVMGQVTGLWCTAHYTGGIGGNIGGAWLMQFHGWRAAFATPAALLATMAVGAALLLPAHPGGGAGGAGKGAPQKQTEIAHVGSVGSAVSDQRFKRLGNGSDHGGVPVTAAPQPPISRLLCLPGLAHISGAYFFIKLVRYSCMFWLPFFLSHAMGLGEAAAGYMATAFDAGGLLGTFSAGWASDKIMQGRRASTALPLALATAAAFAVYNWAFSSTTLLVDVPVLNMLLIGVFGACIAGPDFLLAGPAAQELARNGGLPQCTATVAGMVDGFGSFGAVMQGAVTSYTTQVYGWSALYTLFSVMLVSTAGLLAQPAARESRLLRHKIDGDSRRGHEAALPR